MILALDEVQEIIETVLHTCFVKNAVPISVILIAPSGAAKSTMIRRMQGRFIHQTDSFSQTGLFEIARTDPKNEKRVLSVGDINPTLSRKASTVKAAVAALLSLTYDGCVRVDDGRQTKECKHAPMMLITGATPDVYHSHAKQWFALGLRRRVIPIFYTYSKETERKLNQAVRASEINSATQRPIRLKMRTMQTPNISSKIALEIEMTSLKFTPLLSKVSFNYGYHSAYHVKRWVVQEMISIPPHIIMRTLAQAHAIRDNRKQVDAADMSFLNRFLDFSDPEHPKKL